MDETTKKNSFITTYKKKEIKMALEASVVMES